MSKEFYQVGYQDIQEYNKVLEGNKLYVQKKTQQDPDYFTKLSQGQQPKYLLIGCSDSRAPPNEITETDPGEIFIHRNIANLVIPTDMNINCVIQYAVEHLKVHNIVVMGHTFCGGIKAAMNQDSVGGLLDLWLNNIKITYEKYQRIVDSFTNEDDRVNCLSCMSIREQVLSIWRNPIIQKSWASGHRKIIYLNIAVMVHGWLFRVETGYIEELSIDQAIPEEVSKIFNFKFPEKVEEYLNSPKARKSLAGRSTRFSRLQSLLVQEVKLNVDEDQILEELETQKDLFSFQQDIE